MELLLLATLLVVVAGEEVPQCCPTGSAVGAGGGCEERRGEGAWLATLPPTPFSAITEKVINASLYPGKDGLLCGEGGVKVLEQREGEEGWLVVVGGGGAELYLPSSGAITEHFCVEELQEGGKVVGSTAWYCRGEEEEEEEDGCMDRICVSVCCPKGSLMMQVGV